MAEKKSGKKAAGKKAAAAKATGDFGERVGEIISALDEASQKLDDYLKAGTEINEAKLVALEHRIMRVSPSVARFTSTSDASAARIAKREEKALAIINERREREGKPALKSLDEV